jgi:hypothetical protein
MPQDRRQRFYDALDHLGYDNGRYGLPLHQQIGLARRNGLAVALQALAASHGKVIALPELDPEGYFGITVTADLDDAGVIVHDRLDVTFGKNLAAALSRVPLLWDGGTKWLSNHHYTCRIHHLDVDKLFAMIAAERKSEAAARLVSPEL